MFDFDPTDILGEWEGYDVEAVGGYLRGQEVPSRIRIELSPREDRLGRCSGCGRRVAAVHDTTNRIVRDLPILDAETDLVVPRRRLALPAVRAEAGAPVLAVAMGTGDAADWRNR